MAVTIQNKLFQMWTFQKDRIASAFFFFSGHRPDQRRDGTGLRHHRRSADGRGGEDDPAGGRGRQGRPPPPRGLHPPDQPPVAQGRRQRTGGL